LPIRWAPGRRVWGSSPPKSPLLWLIGSALRKKGEEPQAHLNHHFYGWLGQPSGRRGKSLRPT
jgi:hypothetical protein